MVRGPDEFESALTTMVSERADAVVVQGSLAVRPLVDLAIKYRLPMVSTTRAFADIGGLMSFGADGPAAFRHGAKLIQKILQGRQPKDVPIEQPQSSNWPSISRLRGPWALRSQIRSCCAPTQCSNEAAT